MIQIDQHEFTQKLAETYYRQSISFYTELIDLQVKQDFAERKIEELQKQIQDLETQIISLSTKEEEIDVNSTSDT